MTPADQISHFVVYGDFLSNCGAIYKGVPAIVCNIDESYYWTYLANPKSASLNYPLELTKMFAGLRSLWITPFSTKQLSPDTTCFMTYTAFVYSNLYFLRYWLRSC